MAVLRDWRDLGVHFNILKSQITLIDYFTETDRIRGFTSAPQDLLRAAPGVQCRRQESPTWSPIFQCYLPTNFLSLLFLTSSCQGCRWWRPCLQLLMPLGALWTLSVTLSVMFTINLCVWNEGGTNSSAYLTKTSTRYVRCANLGRRYSMLEAMIQPLIRFLTTNGGPLLPTKPIPFYHFELIYFTAMHIISSGIRLQQ